LRDHAVKAAPEQGDPMTRVLALTFALFLAIAGAAQGASFTDTYEAHNDRAWWGESCSLEQPIIGAEPDVAGTYPVLIWATGTGAEGEWGGTPTNLTKPYDQALAKAVVKAAADNGFVAAYGQYRGRWTVGSNAGTDLQAKCMFNRPAAPKSLLDAVCARPKADCSRIVVAGHSQGGLIALRAANYERSVKAAWPMGVFSAGADPLYWTSVERGGQRVLPDAGVRIATGKADMDAWWIPNHRSGDYSGLNVFTGRSCANGTVNCFRADGSGWHVVQHAAPPAGPTDRHADHCFMNQNGYTCTEPQPVDPFWRDGTAPWTLGPALDWLRGKADA
jgi:hypothetical protein